jgi:hypothetical protein
LIWINACALELTAHEAAMTTHHLRRGIITVVLIKISIVILAALFVFGPRQRPLIDSNALNHQILNNSDR